MNTEPQDPLWDRLSKMLFGAHQTHDESLFTYRVMQEIRLLQPALAQVTWRHFLKWAVPALGVGVATLVLVTRTPAFLVDDPVSISTSDY